MKERNWLTFAKNAGIVLAVLLAFTQLWDWATAPEDELVAHVDFGPFLQPPQLDEQFERFAELRDRDKLAELIELDRLLTDTDDRAAQEAAREALASVSWLLRERLPTSLPYEFRLSGIWFVRIANDSPRSLSDVTITLPNTRYVSIKREGEDPTHLATSDVIPLGTMRPRESLSLVSWATYEASAFQAEQIKLTHSEGIGEVVVRAPVGPFAQWVDKHLFLLLIAFVWLALMSLLVVAESLTARSRPVSAEPEQEDVETGDSDGAP